LTKDIHVVAPDGRRVLGELLDISEHGLVFFIKIGRAPVTFQSRY
jgi:hypothetical protein